MPIMIKEIPLLMIEKKDVEGMVKIFGVGLQSYLGQGYNEAIDEQGTRKIRTNREKLAKLIHETKMIGMTKHYQIDYQWSLQIADAIELNLKDILESVE